MNCPNCKEVLKAEMYEGVEIDKCESCKGVWLDLGEMAHILEKEEKTFSPDLIKKTLNSAFAGIPKEEKLSERDCPHCQTNMHPVNYSYSSGILLDKCNEHGVWLDHIEIDKLQVHAEEWRKRAEKSKGEWQAKLSSIESNGDSLDEGPSNFAFMNRVINFVVNL